MSGTIYLLTGHYPVDDGWQNVIKKCPAKIMWKDKKIISGCEVCCLLCRFHTLS